MVKRASKIKMVKAGGLWEVWHFGAIKQRVGRKKLRKIKSVKQFMTKSAAKRYTTNLRRR